MGDFYRILLWEGANAKMSMIFYVTMVKNVLLFASDMWVVLHRKDENTESFHNQEAHQISNRVTWRHGNSIWVCPLIG